MDDSGKLQAYVNKTVKNNNVYVKAFKGEGGRGGWNNKDSYSEYMSLFGKI